MTIGFPFVVYGYVYDSNSDLVGEGVTITATGDSATTDVTDSDSKYIINLMNYATSGGNVTMTCNYLGEKISSTFKVVVSDPGKNLDIILQEAVASNDIYVNTHHKYGNELYVFTPYDKESWCKTSDY